ncbi:hypothetical protein DEM91_03135 [Prevotella sp. TCVGH]|nr:hypothetical protein [Prevotella sp. TCVGH]
MAYHQTTRYYHQAHAIEYIFTSTPRKEKTRNVLSRIFSIITFLYISLQKIGCALTKKINFLCIRLALSLQ